MIRFVVLMISLLCAECARAEVRFACPRSLILERAGLDSCFVRWNEKDAEFCIPHELWKSALKRLKSSDDWCGEWLVRIKESSVLRDEPERVLPPKAMRVRWVAKALPQSKNEHSLFGVARFRVEQLREQASLWLAPWDHFGVLRQGLLGERAQTRVSSLLRILGFVHLYNATGIHLLALALWVSTMISWVGQQLGADVARTRLVASAVSSITWIIVWIFTGLRAGMLRPLLLVSLQASARSLGWTWRPGIPLLMAVGCDLCVAVAYHAFGMSHAWAPGRWIYALAVGGGMAGLALVRSASNERRSFGLKEHAAMAIGSWLPVALVELVMEHRIAWATPMLSVITIPIFVSLVLPGAVLYLCLRFFDIPSHWIIEVLSQVSNTVIEFCSASVLRWGGVWIVEWGLGVVVATALAWWVCHFPKIYRAWAFVGAMIVCAVFRVSGVFERDHLEQLDVGQGDALFIKDPVLGAGLVDVGPEWARSETAWLEVFARRGITHLDWIALTHLDTDHVGALARLSGLITIGCVGVAPEQLSGQRGQQLRSVLSRLQFQSPAQCAPIKSLLPEAGRPDARNASMTAYYVDSRLGRVLVMGDSDRQNEARIARWCTEIEGCASGQTILKVSHHGSRFSSIRSVIESIRPREAWISSGWGNGYGHPAPTTLNTLSKLNIPVRRTDREGTLSPRERVKRSKKPIDIVTDLRVP